MEEWENFYEIDGEQIDNIHQEVKSIMKIRYLSLRCWAELSSNTCLFFRGGYKKSVLGKWLNKNRVVKDITTLYEIVSIILSYVQKNNLNQDKANSDIILSDNSLSLVLRHNGKYVNKRIKVFHPGQIIKLIRKDLKYQRPPFCHALKMSKER